MVEKLQTFVRSVAAYPRKNPIVFFMGVIGLVLLFMLFVLALVDSGLEEKGTVTQPTSQAELKAVVVPEDNQTSKTPEQAAQDAYNEVQEEARQGSKELDVLITQAFSARQLGKKEEAINASKKALDVIASIEGYEQIYPSTVIALRAIAEGK